MPWMASMAKMALMITISDSPDGHYYPDGPDVQDGPNGHYCLDGPDVQDGPDGQGGETEPRAAALPGPVSAGPL